MNKRIKELYEQSFLTDDYVNVGINGVELGIKFDPEKFAELIVQDCIDIISPYTVKMSRPGEEYLHPITEIKKHFGVEE